VATIGKRWGKLLCCCLVLRLPEYRCVPFAVVMRCAPVAAVMLRQRVPLSYRSVATVATVALEVSLRCSGHVSPSLEDKG
jgi:hypothetical protein